MRFHTHLFVSKIIHNVNTGF